MADLSLIEREAANLRRHAATGDFAAAESTARLYTEMVAARMRQMPLARAEEILRDSCELLEWARRTLCAARERLGARLRQLDGALRYRQPTPSRITNSWRIRA